MIDWCIWLGVSFEYLKMHGTTNLKKSSFVMSVRMEQLGSHCTDFY
jgi:creatinine amidohydrolase/Fe(II)-dependent formamide hydrolase-like protein